MRVRPFNKDYSSMDVLFVYCLCCVGKIDRGMLQLTPNITRRQSSFSDRIRTRVNLGYVTSGKICGNRDRKTKEILDSLLSWRRMVSAHKMINAVVDRKIGVEKHDSSCQSARHLMIFGLS